MLQSSMRKSDWASSDQKIDRNALDHTSRAPFGRGSCVWGRQHQLCAEHHDEHVRQEHRPERRSGQGRGEGGVAQLVRLPGWMDVQAALEQQPVPRPHCPIGEVPRRESSRLNEGSSLI